MLVHFPTIWIWSVKVYDGFQLSWRLPIVSTQYVESGCIETWFYNIFFQMTHLFICKDAECALQYLIYGSGVSLRSRVLSSWDLGVKEPYRRSAKILLAQIDDRTDARLLWQKTKLWKPKSSFLNNVFSKSLSRVSSSFLRNETQSPAVSIERLLPSSCPRAVDRVSSSHHVESTEHDFDKRRIQWHRN